MTEATHTDTKSWLIGLLGEHITGSLTPPMHEAEARRQGLSFTYRTLDTDLMSSKVLQGRLAPHEVDWPLLIEIAREFTFDGLNVTHPAKQAVQPALDELSVDAELLGAVNTVVFRDGRAIGENTDFRGFEDALVAMGGSAGIGGVDLSNVIQLGAGGAGSATAYALLRSGAERLSIVDVDPERAQALKDHLSQAFDASRITLVAPDDVSEAVRQASGLVNSTPIGMTGVSDDSPINVEVLHPDLWVSDVVYRPLQTTLVKAALARGCKAFGGADMVVGQAAVAFELFTGHAADRNAMQQTFLAEAKRLWG